jgi:8-oxo-dGTP diphosphatase
MHPSMVAALPRRCKSTARMFSRCACSGVPAVLNWNFSPVPMLMPYTPIAATLGYVLSPDRGEVLMIHRNARPDDLHLGKYNGLGGKMEPGEDIATCMRREILEEAGITCESMQLRGSLNWPGFGKHGEDWLGFIFVIDRYSGTPLLSNPEGTLEWVALERLMSLPMWEGDRHFLPLVFDADPRPFHGVMPYKDGRMQSWSYTR